MCFDRFPLLIRISSMGQLTDFKGYKELILKNTVMRFSMDMIKKKKTIKIASICSASVVLGYFFCLLLVWGLLCFCFCAFYFSLCYLSCFTLASSFCLSICHPLPRAAVGYTCLSYPLHWWGKTEVGGRERPCFVSLFLLAMLSCFP